MKHYVAVERVMHRIAIARAVESNLIRLVGFQASCTFNSLKLLA
jgi:hypothetical protein